MAEQTDSSQKIFGQIVAVRLGIALLLGYGFLTAFAAYDKHRLPAIEKATAPTAVGDQAFFPVPKTFDPSVPLVNFEGHSLYFVDWASALDTTMTKAGMDDTNSFSIYKIAGAKSAGASMLYLKIKQSYYVKMKTQ